MTLISCPMRNGCLECAVVIASVTAPPPTRPLPLLLPTRGAAQGRLTRTTRTLPGPTPQSAWRIPRRPLLLVDLHPRQDLGVHVGRQDGHGAEQRHPRWVCRSVLEFQDFGAMSTFDVPLWSFLFFPFPMYDQTCPGLLCLPLKISAIC